ncbi:hypothetical protein GPECTOR_32g469 [Gonium pectorale]|uniref:Diacylglycerol kinase accessory domain-containing protein n=1 Tax=Gonium pectorale TaxID=33097 RepID=A0A150GDD0_GONPE|nr:hypothetical protein GPECTOR_32g469 [Gonium pectorale]|eukprot:KXZ47857.1 hypothetical protein GPECTOR_32g469 [Gonium pectorale]
MLLRWYAAARGSAFVAIATAALRNDLARVLGWGGGVAALEARGGVAAVLAEVAAAAATALDRWALGIAPAPQELVKRRPSFLPRRRQATAAAPPRSPPAVTQTKVWNNYLGVGIDSWCALEFHRMRERYPGWFRSQLGNKMWYTGVGARDLLARSCVDLPRRLQGILLLSIPSYMGGVDLWGHGLPPPPPTTTTAPAPAPTPAPTAGAQPPPPQSAASPWSALSPLSSSAAAPVSPQRNERTAGPGGATGGAGSPSGPSRASADAAQPAAQALNAGAQLAPPLHAPSPSALTSAPTLTSLAAAPNATPLPCVPQSMSDGILEVVAVYGAVHLGKLQVGLARATRLCQCRSATITTNQALPMQIDGEPWMQPPAQLTVRLQGSATMLRRLDLSSAAARLTAAVGEVLDGAVASGTISAAQRQALGVQMAQRLGAPHAV